MSGYPANIDHSAADFMAALDDYIEVRIRYAEWDNATVGGMFRRQGQDQFLQEVQEKRQKVATMFQRNVEAITQGAQ